MDLWATTSDLRAGDKGGRRPPHLALTDRRRKRHADAFMMNWAQRLSVLSLLLTSIAASSAEAEEFTEELLLRPLPDRKVLARSRSAHQHPSSMPSPPGTGLFAPQLSLKVFQTPRPRHEDLPYGTIVTCTDAISEADHEDANIVYHAPSMNSAVPRSPACGRRAGWWCPTLGAMPERWELAAGVLSLEDRSCGRSSSVWLHGEIARISIISKTTKRRDVDAERVAVAPDERGEVGGPRAAVHERPSPAAPTTASSSSSSMFPAARKAATTTRATPGGGRGTWCSAWDGRPARRGWRFARRSSAHGVPLMPWLPAMSVATNLPVNG